MREALTTLREEYTRMGDKLEQEQSTVLQLRRVPFPMFDVMFVGGERSGWRDAVDGRLQQEGTAETQLRRASFIRRAEFCGWGRWPTA